MNTKLNSEKNEMNSFNEAGPIESTMDISGWKIRLGPKTIEVLWTGRGCPESGRCVIGYISLAIKFLRHASFQLGKAAYEIDEYLKDFSIARVPIRRQVILNEAIGHLVANVLPNLGIAEMARVQVQLALRDK